jgi:hypothetical protein
VACQVSEGYYPAPLSGWNCEDEFNWKDGIWQITEPDETCRVAVEPEVYHSKKVGA